MPRRPGCSWRAVQLMMGRIIGTVRRWTGSLRRSGKASAETSSVPFLERLSDPSLHGSEEVAGQLRARQVNAIQRLAIPLMIVNLVNVAAVLLQLRLTGQLGAAALAWSAVTAIIAIAALVKAIPKRNRDVPRTTSRKTVGRVIRSSFFFGILWAVPGLAILPQLSGMALAFTTALLTGMIAGGAIVLYPIPAAAFSFMLPVAVSGVTGLVLSQGLLAVGPAVLALAFLYIFLGIVRRHSELFVSEFVARLASLPRGSAPARAPPRRWAR